MAKPVRGSEERLDDEEFRKRFVQLAKEYKKKTPEQRQQVLERRPAPPPSENKQECTLKQPPVECIEYGRGGGGSVYVCFQDDHDWDDSYPDDTPKQHRAHFDLLFRRHGRQICQSKGFDTLDYPGCPATIMPLRNFSAQYELLMELANRAIQEYNEKACNVFKYKVLKIEKVNYMMSTYRHYLMIVKVLNLTLGTPIDTFQIHVGERIWRDRKIIFSCWSKEEAAVASELYGMFAKRKGEVCQGSKGAGIWPVEQ